MAASYEWRIAEHLSNGGHTYYGYMWVCIDEDNNLCVMLDPDGAERDLSREDMEVPQGSLIYKRILAYWRKIGSPVLDPQKVESWAASDYEAPWFPWEDAGFSLKEHTELTDPEHMVSVANEFERAAEAAEHMEQEA
jgi:hypothetical protein